ncbi:hypothetical protein CB1_000390080 [Camelus ferus]|nr:hypothetical protein CB1_000390080 [Camelus ferus]
MQGSGCRSAVGNLPFRNSRRTFMTKHRLSNAAPASSSPNLSAGLGSQITKPANPVPSKTNENPHLRCALAWRDGFPAQPKASVTTVEQPYWAKWAVNHGRAGLKVGGREGRLALSSSPGDHGLVTSKKSSSLKSTQERRLCHLWAPMLRTSPGDRGRGVTGIIKEEENGALVKPPWLWGGRETLARLTCYNKCKANSEYLMRSRPDVTGRENLSRGPKVTGVKRFVQANRAETDGFGPG